MDTIQDICQARLEAEYEALQRELASIIQGDQAAWDSWPEHVEQRRLATLEQALARLASGSFGRCLRCKQDIDQERLLFMPQAELCITCQRQTEHRSPTQRARYRLESIAA